MENKSPQILVEDKWDSYVVEGGDLAEAALKLLTNRLNDGFWYDDWSDGREDHQYETRAKAIVEAGDGKAAWRFLKSRRDFEYEWVEVARVI